MATGRVPAPAAATTCKRPAPPQRHTTRTAGEGGDRGTRGGRYRWSAGASGTAHSAKLRRRARPDAASSRRARASQIQLAVRVPSWLVSRSSTRQRPSARRVACHSASSSVSAVARATSCSSVSERRTFTVGDVCCPGAAQHVGHLGLDRCGPPQHAVDVRARRAGDGLGAHAPTQPSLDLGRRGLASDVTLPALGHDPRIGQQVARRGPGRLGQQQRSVGIGADHVELAHDASVTATR